VTAGRDAPAARSGGAQRLLNLIHRNNCSNPASMRVPGRLPRLILNPVRTALYAPVLLVPHLPGGPLRWVWIVRLVVNLDAPLRRYLLGGVNART
jgi:hypothetical protein